MPTTIAQGVDQRFRWHRRLVRRRLPNIGTCLNSSVRFSSLVGRPLSVHALLTPARAVDVSQVPEVVRIPWHPYLSMWRSRNTTDDDLAQELAGVRPAGLLPRATQMPRGQFAPTSGLRRLRQEVLPVRLPADVAAVGPILTDRERKFGSGSRAPDRVVSLPRPTAPQLKPVAAQLASKIQDDRMVVRRPTEHSESSGSGDPPRGSSIGGASSSVDNVGSPTESGGLEKTIEATPMNHQSTSSIGIPETGAERTVPAGSSVSGPAANPGHEASNALRSEMAMPRQSAFTLAGTGGHDPTERSGGGNPQRPNGGGVLPGQQPSATDLLAVSFMLLEALGTSFQPALLARRGAEHVGESGPFWQYTTHFPRTSFARSGNKALATVQRRLPLTPSAKPSSREAALGRAFSVAGAPVALRATPRAGYHAMSRATSPAVGSSVTGIGWDVHHDNGREDLSFPHAGDVGGGGRRSLALALAAWELGSSSVASRWSPGRPGQRQGYDTSRWSHRRGVPSHQGRQMMHLGGDTHPTHEDNVLMSSLASAYRLDHALRQFRVSAPSRGILRSALMTALMTGRFYSPVNQGLGVASLQPELGRSALGFGEVVHPRGVPVGEFGPRYYRLRGGRDNQGGPQREQGSSSRGTGWYGSDNRHDGENRTTTRQRFAQALGMQPRDSLRPLPARFRPLAQALGVVRPVHIRTGDSTRQALQQVGQAGATYRGIIHLQKEPDGSPASVDVLAHELVHARLGKAAEPRFFRDRKIDSEEIMARRVGSLASTLVGESTSLQVSSGLSQALRTTKTVSRFPPSSRTDNPRLPQDHTVETTDQRRSVAADARTAPSQSFEKLLEYFRGMEHPQLDTSTISNGGIGLAPKPPLPPNDPHPLPAIVRDGRGSFKVSNLNSGRSHPGIVDRGIVDVKKEDEPLVGSSSAPQTEEFLDWLVEQVERRLLREFEARGQRHMPDVL
ncbi:DUF4157 domain-containing protein [Ferrimicrobium sp.]|uniref:eCIS core domain-containing protein n=1 Tax=Ferrimicrobium sp. TaxID=2926050 RepID=UPI00261C1969|nr:DUF4157 domain-containing protein [Ferrimicrobium sp.]